LNYQVIGPSRIENQLWQLQRQIDNLSVPSNGSASTVQAGPSRAEAEAMCNALTQRIAALEADVAQMKSVARAIHPLTHASQKSPESSASASRDEGYAKFHKVGTSQQAQA
jgi:uncharacterized membrane protein